VTLTGPGGVGKTRLALELAAAIEAEDADGVVFVPLADVSDPGLVLPTVAAALGLQDEGGLPLPERIATAVRGRRLVLILDNLEQVLGAATAISHLLGRCPDLSVLATSRAPLHVRGEREFPLGPLPIPDPAALPPPQELAGQASVALFADRARAVDPAFAISAENAGAVATLCAQLDGLPLAIELAAAWTKLLAPAALLSTFTDRLQLLTRGPRDLPDRQRTMRDAIGWSYDLLAPPLRTTFRRLAVFRGGATVEAIAAVVADEAPADPLAVFDALSELTDQSLLRGGEERSGEASRFRMLETIREFGREQLVEAGELEAVRARHFAYFLGLVEGAELKLVGPEQAEWLRRLDREVDNIRAALAFALESGRAQSVLRIGVCLAQFWGVRGLLRQESVWLDQALALPTEGIAEPVTDPALVARALGMLGIVAFEAGDYPLARERLEASLGMRRELGDRFGIANMLNNLALIATGEGDHAQARALHEESIAVRRALGSERAVGSALVNLGDTLNSLGEHGQARAAFEEALAMAGRQGDPRVHAHALNNLAETAWFEGDVAAAGRLADEALTAAQALGDRRAIASCLLNLARFVAAGGDPDRSARLLAEAIVLLRDQGNPAALAEALDALAGPVAARGDLERAARLLGAADGLRRWRPATPAPIARQTRIEAERAVAARLTAKRREAAIEEGRALTIEQAAAEAIGAALLPPTAVERPSEAPTGGPAERDYGLTPREVEVLRLLVEAKTDREIGETLFISARTAMSHVANILGKLGVESRTGAATFAVRHGLV
jgi:predicted ATPase/DNA-binding CsgD family transcriptional regulator